jgi:hypothetical protein
MLNSKVKIRGFTPGAFQSVKDPRDWLFSTVAGVKTIKDIPVKGGIDDLPLIIRDQKDLPTCTGEAGRYIQMISQYYETGKITDLSAMFIYNLNKQHDGLPPDAEGSTLRATADTLRLLGVCREILFPSVKSNYLLTPGGSEMMADAYQHRIVAYTKCRNLEDILLSLADKKPVMFSMFLLSDFFKAKNGKVPAKVGGGFVGGHAMVAVSYDLEQEWVKIVQSYGTDTSLTDKGYMYIPFSWFEFVFEDFGGWPMLMDAYNVLDFIPPTPVEVPEKITVGKRLPTIEVNGQEIKGRIPAIIAQEWDATLVHIRVLEQISSIMEQITGHKVEVKWDENNYVVRINI